MLPLARELLRRGTGVILTANATPTLNDVTHDELVPIVNGVAAWDPILGDALRDGRLELVSSGNGLPLIDLTRVSAELVDAVERRGVDLVVIEGMGRAVESNLDARFTCDVLKIAMVKDRGVADELGGKVYDLVLRFEPV
jgi:type II pantothenate kinase